MKNLIFLLTLLLSISCTQDKQQLLILCTNDTHSQIEAKDGQGGYAARAEVIDSLRNIYPLNLLLDAGDIVQGTPYFNVYHGRIEVEGYNRLGYDAVALGNHEFDMGLDTLAMWLKLADYQIVCCNYDVKNTPLENIVEPYAIFERGGMKIGVIGFGVSPESLILPANFEPVKYLDPIEKGNFYADSLKNAGCGLIIALSHLGYYNDSTVVSDLRLAQQSRNIDLILGGHTHNVCGKFTTQNLDNKPVTIMQTSKAGKEMDKIIVEF
ncbi:MAG: metallophosphoesterase [Prevotellaceae bacterium]|jgi:5'-nucleotidase|nr:metallophosphoesterase [Prevotellaceae bacterium]